MEDLDLFWNAFQEAELTKAHPYQGREVSDTELSGYDTLDKALKQAQEKAQRKAGKK